MRDWPLDLPAPGPSHLRTLDFSRGFLSLTLLFFCIVLQATFSCPLYLLVVRTLRGTHFTIESYVKSVGKTPHGDPRGFGRSKPRRSDSVRPRSEQRDFYGPSFLNRFSNPGCRHKTKTERRQALTKAYRDYRRSTLEVQERVEFVLV